MEDDSPASSSGMVCDSETILPNRSPMPRFRASISTVSSSAISVFDSSTLTRARKYGSSSKTCWISMRAMPWTIMRMPPSGTFAIMRMTTATPIG